MTRPTNAPTCEAIRRDGARCQSHALAGDNKCFWHSQRISEDQRHEAARRGGLASTQRKVMPASTPDVALRTPEMCLALLEDTISRLRRGELDVRTANGISYAAGVACKTWEVMLGRRLRKLERLVAGRIRS